MDVIGTALNSFQGVFDAIRQLVIVTHILPIILTELKSSIALSSPVDSYLALDCLSMIIEQGNVHLLLRPIRRADLAMAQMRRALNLT